MAQNQPNILLVVVDCLRADRTLESQRSAQVPTLQSLARRGAAFSHMITVNSVTIYTRQKTGFYLIKITWRVISRNIKRIIVISSPTLSKEENFLVGRFIYHRAAVHKIIMVGRPI